MQRIVYIMFLITIGLHAHSQSYKKVMAPEAYRHHVAYADHQISFHTLSLDKTVRTVKRNKLYHWWGGGQMNITQGGYSGKLLHGNFSSYYLNKQLKQQGEFKKGLKDGEWKEWNEKGMLILRTHYLEGIANGTFYRYNDEGRLLEKGNYQNGQIDGKLRKYVSSDSVNISSYRKGILQSERKKTTWWKFWKKKKE